MVLVALIPIVTYAQCDTLPVAQRWESVNNDSSFISFLRASQNGDPATVVLGGTRTSSAEHNSTISYPNGNPKFIFNGSQLFRGGDYALLANGVTLGSDSMNGAGRNLGISVIQHLILPAPNDTNKIFIFHCEASRTVQSAADSAWENNLHAYLSIYDAQLDSFTLRDSVLHRRATESWAAMRHPDGESWWLATRVHSPSAILTYKLSSQGLDPAIRSLGGPVFGWREVEDVGGITFSSSGKHIGWSVRASTRTDTIRGEHWVMDFDCSTGQGSFPIQIDNDLFPGGGCAVSFSAQGSYLYGVKDDSIGNIRENDIHRYRIDLTGNHQHGAPEVIYNSNRNFGVTLGPDNRIYGGPGGNFKYIDYPDRWQSFTDPNTNAYSGGATSIRYPRFPIISLGLNAPHAPIDLPRLRQPKLAGDNFVTCGDTLEYLLVENCYQELSDITYELGPGIQLVQDNNPQLSIAFDTAQSFESVRYVALTNNHACRTYRDTFWIYVDGCENMCTPIFSSEAIAACDSALVHGQWQFASNSYTQTFQNFEGCDSTSTIQLTINNSIQTSSMLSACDSALVHGNWVTASGEYPTSFNTVQGCDSTSMVTVSINSQLTTSEQVSGCDSAFVAGEWRYITGDYPEIFQSIQGCDSIHTVQLSLKQSANTSDFIAACDSAFIHQDWVFISGSYPQTYTSFQGCDSTSTIELVITPTPPSVQFPVDTTLAAQVGYSLNLDSLATFAFDWQPPIAVDCSDCSIVEVMAGFAGRLTVEIGEAPCSLTASLLINRENREASTFATPTAFSPNGDGNNDFFEIALPPDSELLELAIYDRWGSMVYQGACPCTSNINGLIETWNGIYQGKPANSGVFAWIVRVRNAQGEERLEKGDVTLVR